MRCHVPGRMIRDQAVPCGRQVCYLKEPSMSWKPKTHWGMPSVTALHGRHSHRMPLERGNDRGHPARDARDQPIGVHLPICAQ